MCLYVTARYIRIHKSIQLPRIFTGHSLSYTPCIITVYLHPPTRIIQCTRRSIYQTNNTPSSHNITYIPFSALTYRLPTQKYITGSWNVERGGTWALGTLERDIVTLTLGYPGPGRRLRFRGIGRRLGIGQISCDFVKLKILRTEPGRFPHDHLPASVDLLAISLRCETPHEVLSPS
jgi:hypothetical protein